MSAPQRWSRLGALLDSALDTPPEDRVHLVTEASEEDPSLGGELEELLRLSGGTGLLDRPVGELVADLLQDGEAAAPFAGQRIGPFEIRRLLGTGGMGEVYEALDTRLHRPVALKFLPSWSRGPQAKERLLREARAVSALDHPNICTLYDIGESTDGRLYLVMGYYAGETLDRRIARGPLGVEEALEITRQVGSGLARAHGAGIIHRDVKPSNVVLTEEGPAKILDFGIARVAGATALTATGGRPGTPAYMSPEQAAGAEVGAGTDVWALGALLYEMLTGRRPFGAEDPRALIHGILHGHPIPVRDLRGEVPPGVERAVAGALAKDPARRFPTVGAFLSALEGEEAGRTVPEPLRRLFRRRGGRRALAGVAALVALAGAGLWWSGPRPLLESDRTESTASPSGSGAADLLEAAPLVAVLPLDNRTGDAALGWYGSGLAQLVADALAPSRHLQVASPRRALALATAEGDLEATAAAAGVGYLLTGEILAMEEGYRLAVRVTSTAESRQLASYRRDMALPRELLAAADEIALTARKVLGVPPEESVDVFAADFASDNPRAYEHYLEGLQAFSTYDYGPAEAAFARALVEAPTFTMARYRLAYVQAATGRTEEALQEIRQAAAQAHRLPDRERRYIEAAALYIERRYDEALRAYRSLVERYPYEIEARSQLVLLLRPQGRHQEQLAILDTLTRLAPEDPAVWSMSGEIRLRLGQLQQAMLDLQRYAALAPESANAHHALGNAYRAQEELVLAADEYLRALELDPGFGRAAVDLAIVEVLQGKRGQAEDRLSSLLHSAEVLPKHRIDAAFQLAALLRSEGRFAAAARHLADLEEAIEGESVREAWALSLRGNAAMELGRRAEARTLLSRAVERSPTPVATRYLYARGLLELREGRWQDLEVTLGSILRGALPRGDPNRGAEEKAAADLAGLRALARGEVGRAVEELELAVTLEGFSYRLYRLDLAEAYLAAGRLPQALATVRQALEERPLAEPRLDLELDRVRARLLLARIHQARGDAAQAALHAHTFLDLWSRADGDLPELALARRLAALSVLAPDEG